MVGSLGLADSPILRLSNGDSSLCRHLMVGPDISKVAGGEIGAKGITWGREKKRGRWCPNSSRDQCAGLMQRGRTRSRISSTEAASDSDVTDRSTELQDLNGTFTRLVQQRRMGFCSNCLNYTVVQRPYFCGVLIPCS